MVGRKGDVGFNEKGGHMMGLLNLKELQVGCDRSVNLRYWPINVMLSSFNQSVFNM